MSKVDIHDVAEEAEVSPATVSRVVNQSAKVSKAKEKRVREAINKLGYKPNRFARSLRKQESNVIGVIVPDISNPFFASLVRGAESAVRETGKSITIYDTNNQIRQASDYVKLIIQEKVQGALYITSSGKKEIVQKLVDAGILVVLVDRILGEPDLSLPNVVADNLQGSIAITNHLLDQGCKSIGYIRGPKGISTASERYNGFSLALERGGFKKRSEFIKTGDYSFRSGKEAAKEFLDEFDEQGLPDGILAANDLMAVGAMREFEKAGVNIPGELAIGGFDDILLSKLVNPSLTTVRSPAYEMGRRAVKLMVDNQNSHDQRERDQIKKLMLETTLIVRESSDWSSG